MARCERCESDDVYQTTHVLDCRACGWLSFRCPECDSTLFRRERYGNNLDSGTYPPRGLTIECLRCGATTWHEDEDCPCLMCGRKEVG